jgi:hypothetical protein
MRELSPDELTRILENIEVQRRELEAAQRQPADQKSLEIFGLNYAYGALPEKQRRAIAPEIDTAPEDFLVAFMKAMRSELCTEGGALFEQWKQYSDVSAEPLAKKVSKRLIEMGFEGKAIATLTEAISVCILWLGVKVFCDRYSTFQ